MTDKINVAVVGATGAVGEAMLEILAERRFPVGTVYALAIALGFSALLKSSLATSAQTKSPTRAA